MSSEVVSPSKLQYSRDFLLQYSSIQKEEPAIADKLVTVLNTPGQPVKQSKRGGGPKSPNPRNTDNNNSNNNFYQNGFSKTPNPRKTGAQTIYAQKENIPAPSIRSSVESYTTPARREVLAPRSRPYLKSPNSRKTWVAAVEASTEPNTTQNYTENPATNSVTNGTHNPTVTSETFQMVVSNPVPTPDAKVFETPVSSPYPKTPISKKLAPKDGFTSPPRSHTQEPATPASSTSADRLYLSPKSPGPTSTPYKSPTSPGGTKYSPSKSPKSPIRPISPLDEQRLAQRQKQIDYGYRTVGYLRYRLLVSKDHRKPEHPRTPKKTQGCSKRSWDGQLKKWRRDLHLWDPDNADAFKALLNSDLVVSIIAANPELAEIVDIVREKMENPNSYDEELESDSFGSAPTNSSTIALPTTTQEGVVDKKVSPPRIGNDTKVQNKVARTLVFN
jgi:hypothetical protein